MAQLKHRVLAPDRLCVGRDENGQPIFRTFTAADCRAFYERGQKMIEKGFHVPACLSHTDAGPDEALKTILSDSEKGKIARERGTVGFATRYEMDGDAVYVVNEYPDPQDAKQAEKIKYCSPRIARFTDRNGTDWGEVFTHIALTGRPRQNDQPPAVKLGIDLAIDEETGKDKGEEKSESKSDGPPKEKFDEKPKSSGGAKMHKALACLETLGLVLGADTPADLDGFLDRLIVAVETKAAAGTSAGGATAPTKIGPSSEAPPMTLSLDEVNVLKAKIKSRDEKAVRNGRAALEERISRLFESGRIAATTRDSLKGDLTAVTLSVDDDGELVSGKVHFRIEAYESLPPNTAWQATSLGYATGPADRPPGSAASDAEILKHWDEM